MSLAWQDIRYAVRMLVRRPIFAATVVLTLSLGIGANTAIFTVVNGVLLEPLVFPQADRLVNVWGRFLPESGFDFPSFPLSEPEYIDYRDHNVSMQDVALFTYYGANIIDDVGEPDRVSAAALTALRTAITEPVFVDINLRDPWWRPDQVVALLQGADTIKLNRDELERLMTGPLELVEKARQLLQSSGARQLILTCGAAGARIVTAAAEPLQVKPEPQTRVVDTVGAGDAFASVMLLGQLRGWPRQVTARRAQEFAAAVVGLRGATTTERAFYTTFTTRWRDDESTT